MNQWKPCKRHEFIRRLRSLGFDGPYSGTRHSFLTRGNHRLALPSNPEYSVHELRMMIREIENILGRSITTEHWNALD